MEIASGKLTKVDTDYFHELQRDFNWSADSKWIAFARTLPNLFHAIFVYSLEDGKSHQITDGMSDARHPAFDRDGQYLYFIASTNFGPTVSGLDMTSDEHDVTSNVYLAVLPNNIASPLAPESDEEKAPGETPAEGEAGAGRGGRGGRGGGAAPEAPQKPVRIDFDKIARRIIALPLPARNYGSLATGRVGIVFVTETGAGSRGGGGASLVRFDLKTRKSEQVASGVAGFDLSPMATKCCFEWAQAVDAAGGAVRGRLWDRSLPSYRQRPW